MRPATRLLLHGAQGALPLWYTLLFLHGAQGALPLWYIQHRVHAHTRLRIVDECSNKTTGTWKCTGLFDHAGAAFAKLNVPAYVRHTHSGDEGMWWPSTTDPFEAWHPLVQATNRSLPLEFLAEAKASGVNVIFYHYMKTNRFYSTKYPEWTQQWPNGSAVHWQRGVGLSACDTRWTSTYIAQVVQLVKLGADAFYFDEYPQSWGGDWSPECRKRFHALHGDAMPEELAHPACEGQGPAKICQPVAKDRRVLELMRIVTQEYFSSLTAAVTRAAGPGGRAVSLVSTFYVPIPDDGWAGVWGGGIFETTALLRSRGDTVAAKTELQKGSRHPGGFDPAVMGGDRMDELDLDSFGYVLMRDGATEAADGSMAPPHVWVPHLEGQARQGRPEIATCATAALVAHGCIANPDHAERSIPNATLFNATYELGAKLSAAWSEAPSLRPVRWASVLFSESARNAFLPSDPVGAWRQILFPSLGAWSTLLHAAVPARLLVDWQLKTQPANMTVREHPVLVTPPDALLPPYIASGLRAYIAAGGTRLVVSAADGWSMTKHRPAAEAALLTKLRGAAAVPPKVSLSPAPVAGGVQLHAYEDNDGSELLVFILNNFTGCYGRSTLPLPPSVGGLTVEIGSLPPGTTPTSATEVVSGKRLDIVPSPPITRRWAIALPDLRIVAALKIKLSVNSRAIS